MSVLATVAADLRDEQEALDAVVSGIPDQRWTTSTPSPRWTVRDQIGHLTYFDGTAALAVTDPQRFNESISSLLAGDMDAETLHRHLAPGDLLAAWRSNRFALNDIASRLDGSERIPWYGPPMSATSFLTARLMDTWTHGQDVVDALGAERPVTDRLAHIVRLGFITRGWTYVNRREEQPLGDVRLELEAPSGTTWIHGPAEFSSVVRGPALDFCLVVTQRRHLDDTALDVTGDAARDWLTKAQAFAGPPTDGPPPRNSDHSRG